MNSAPDLILPNIILRRSGRPWAGEMADSSLAESERGGVRPGVRGHQTSVSAVILEVRLVQRVVQREAEALSALYDRFSKPLFSFAVHILNDAPEAEDVVQEVFLQIWLKASTYDETVGKPFNWAVTITRHKSIDRLRARCRQRQLLEAAGDAAHIWSAPEARPEENAWRDQSAHLRACLQELPQEQRRPIELAFFRGLTHHEIAQALKEPLGTIKARIRRGLCRLRNDWEGAV